MHSNQTDISTYLTIWLQRLVTKANQTAFGIYSIFVFSKNPASKNGGAMVRMVFMFPEQSDMNMALLLKF